MTDTADGVIDNLLLISILRKIKDDKMAYLHSDLSIHENKTLSLDKIKSIGQLTYISVKSMSKSSGKLNWNYGTYLTDEKQAKLVYTRRFRIPFNPKPGKIIPRNTMLSNSLLHGSELNKHQMLFVSCANVHLDYVSGILKNINII